MGFRDQGLGFRHIEVWALSCQTLGSFFPKSRRRGNTMSYRINEGCQAARGVPWSWRVLNESVATTRVVRVVRVWGSVVQS